MPTIFNFTSGVVADTDPNGGPTAIQATQTIGADTLTVALDGAEAVVMDGAAFGIPNLNGAAFGIANAPSNSVTLSLDSGKIFDLTSVNICDQIGGGDVTYIFTTTKGSVLATIDSSMGAVVVPFSDWRLQGVTSVVITQQEGDLFLAVDDIRLDNIALPNAAPTFVGAGATLTAPQNSGANAASALLHVSDTDSSQTITWTQFAAPAHGTLIITGAIAASGGADISPGGTIIYTPAAGFAGVDTFTVQVSDGTATAIRVISVNVVPGTPQAPDLAAGSDSGRALDYITNADMLSFSGLSATADSSSLVRVFLDTNGNGVFDAGTDATATATVANGAWTVTGLSTTGVSDGDYNVYAQVTSATGNLTSAVSSALVVQIDKTPPGQTLSGLSLSADTGGSDSDFITNTAAQTVRATLSGPLAGDDALYGSLDGGSTWTDISSKVSGTTVDWTGVTLSSSGVLKLKVVDVAGNDGAVASHAYTLDTTAPTLAITSDVSTLKVGETATITFTFSEDPGATFTWNGSTGDVVVSGGTLGAISGSGLTRTATFTPTAVTDGGAASITVASGSYVDVAGNNGAAASTPSLSFDTLAASPPMPALTNSSDSGASGDGVTNINTPTFAGTTEAGATVRLYDTDGVTVLGAAVADGSGAWTITSSQLVDGQHTITAQATDAAGNVSSPSSDVEIVIDTQPPAPPSRPALTSGSDSGAPGDGVTNVNTPTFTGTTEAGATVRLYDTDETTLLGSAVADGLGAWTITSSQLSVGAHTIMAKATDLAGNVSIAGSGVAITIDAIPAPEPQPEPGVVTVVTPGGNQVTGDMQDNLIAPSGGADTVSAGGGNDTVLGGASDDVLQGNVGNDSIAAGGGSDLVYGGQSEDFVNGNTGDDRLYGDKGEDTLHGGQGADFVQGGQGNDYVSGDLGDDVLLGGQGDDQVLGGAGNDYLSGDLGDDTLTGGAGADIFHFGGAGLDLVTDFNQAEGDRVLLDPGTSYVLSQVGGDVHVTMSGGEMILAGVQLSSLTSGWISA